VRVQLVDGPFSLLDGTWLFKPAGPTGRRPAQACKIEFDLRYAFAAGAGSGGQPGLRPVANTFVDSFVQARRAGLWPR
jgi:ribosome-associated toxin RatA of RatAB toxin-antitoxin module